MCVALGVAVVGYGSGAPETSEDTEDYWLIKKWVLPPLIV